MLRQPSDIPGLRGLSALSAVGMPYEFAAQIMLLANEMNIAIAIRAGLPFQIYEVECAPKPSTVKAKTGNWGLTKGVIAHDLALGKHDENGVPVNAGIQKPADIALVQHKVTLGQIISGIQHNPPEFEILRIDGDLLYIRAMPEFAPKSSHVIFSINMHDSNAVHPCKFERKYLETNVVLEGQDNKPIEPTWWKKSWGNFGDRLKDRFPLFYQQEEQALPKSVEIYAIKKANNVLPITGDMDILWMSRSGVSTRFTSMMTYHEIPMHDLLNTKNANERELLFTTLLKMNELDPVKSLDVSRLSLVNLEHFGITSAFEAYLAFSINERFFHFIKHLENLFQHGAENHNPGTPSNLNGKILHIWKGEIILTQSEADLIDFVLNTPGYLEENLITIHPKWNMQLWLPVIEKQMALHQPIPDEVKVDYFLYKDAHDAFPLLSKAVRRLSGTLGSISSTQLISRKLGSKDVSIAAQETLKNHLESSSSSAQEIQAHEPTHSLDETAYIVLSRVKPLSWDTNKSFTEKSKLENVIQLVDSETGNTKWKFSIAEKTLTIQTSNYNMYVNIMPDSIKVSGYNVQVDGKEYNEIMQKILAILCPDEKLHVTFMLVNKLKLKR